jgi:hypothetical protein
VLDLWKRLRRSWRFAVIVAMAALALPILAALLLIVLAMNDLLGLFGLPTVEIPVWLVLFRDHALVVAIAAWALALVVPDLITLVLFHLDRPRLSERAKHLIEDMKTDCGRIVGLLQPTALGDIEEDRTEDARLEILRQMARDGEFFRWPQVSRQRSMLLGVALLFCGMRMRPDLMEGAGGEPWNDDSDASYLRTVHKSYATLVEIADELLAGESLRDTWLLHAKRLRKTDDTSAVTT